MALQMVWRREVRRKWVDLGCMVGDVVMEGLERWEGEQA